jgi:WD40 repeat protein
MPQRVSGSGICSVRLALIAMMICLACCSRENTDNASPEGREPVIDPDYSGVTVPGNIAPLNFRIKEEGKGFIVKAVSSDGASIKISSSDGNVRFPMKSWKTLTSGNRIKLVVFANTADGESKRFDTIYIDVAGEKIDPYICYRLLYPGYEYWSEMKIVQRSTESFRESSVFENQLLDNNCVNCHSFRQNDPGKFLLHVRGSHGGTYFVEGDKVTRRSLRIKEMPANAVYPSWHPSGRFVAFSSNKTVQTFHMRPEKNIEVFDLYSSLFIYDVEKNEMFRCPEKDSVKYMETFPCWSPDGRYLYYCRAREAVKDADYRDVKYDLARKPFNPDTREFGSTEILFDARAINKSVSFPAVSPDGKFLVFTLHDYGTFSIWHREADLYLLNLKDGKSLRMNLNSDETESYHSWSSNGRWLVFSSKRGDGLTARPYFSHIDSAGNSAKPFVLPQKDPGLYSRLSKTFNRPEFLTGKIKVAARDFERASKNDAVQAK